MTLKIKERAPQLCSGIGKIAVASHDGIWLCCPDCGRWTVPYKNGQVRRHNQLEDVDRALTAATEEKENRVPACRILEHVDDDDVVHAAHNRMEELNAERNLNERAENEIEALRGQLAEARERIEYLTTPIPRTLVALHEADCDGWKARDNERVARISQLEGQLAEAQQRRDVLAADLQAVWNRLPEEYRYPEMLDVIDTLRAALIREEPAE